MTDVSFGAILNHVITTMSAEEIRCLADRLFSRGFSTISTYSRREQQDLVLASRVIRELLRRYERSTGRELHSVLIDGGV
jgi:hypothetical protein